MDEECADVVRAQFAAVIAKLEAVPVMDGVSIGKDWWSRGESNP